MGHLEMWHGFSSTLLLFTLRYITDSVYWTVDMSLSKSPKCKSKCPLLEIEERMYLDNILTSNGADTVARRIYEVIRDAEGISLDMKTLYKEGLLGRNANAKRHLRNQMYAIKCLNRYG